MLVPLPAYTPKPSELLPHGSPTATLKATDQKHKSQGKKRAGESIALNGNASTHKICYAIHRTITRRAHQIGVRHGRATEVTPLRAGCPTSTPRLGHPRDRRKPLRKSEAIRATPPSYRDRGPGSPLSDPPSMVCRPAYHRSGARNKTKKSNNSTTRGDQEYVGQEHRMRDAERDSGGE